MNKSCLLVLLMISTFFASSTFLLVFIFTPLELATRSLDSLHSGFIIGWDISYFRFAGVSYFLITYFFSPCLYVRCGLSHSLSLGLIIHGVSLILLGSAYYSHK